MFVIFQDHAIIFEPISDQMYVINRDCVHFTQRKKERIVSINMDSVQFSIYNLYF